MGGGRVPAHLPQPGGAAPVHESDLEGLWRPFTATQEFVPGAPGFVWNARVAMLPGVSVFVRDSFGDGQGAMRGAVWGLIPVVAAEGRIPAVTTSDL